MAGRSHAGVKVAVAQEHGQTSIAVAACRPRPCTAVLRVGFAMPPAGPSCFSAARHRDLPREQSWGQVHVVPMNTGGREQP